MKLPAGRRNEDDERDAVLADKVNLFIPLLAERVTFPGAVASIEPAVPASDQLEPYMANLGP